jgi:hypothetical protein
MTDQTTPAATTPAAPQVASQAARPALAPRQLTFYFSASHRASFAPGRSLSYFKGQEFTQACEIGEQPLARADVVRVGTGTLADVTTRKP